MRERLPMRFFDNQPREQQDYYLRIMGYIASLSGLFSESDEPYYNYRVSENLFCRAFDAENLSRSDVSADASKHTLGIGIKTFLEKNGKSFEKVAEFSSHDVLGSATTEVDLIHEVARLRNERLQVTKNIYNLEQLIYHCVVRNTGYMRIYETDLDEINQDKIRVNASAGNSNNIWFRDDKNEYKFTRSKSTLYKRFFSPNDLQSHVIPVNIHDDPFRLIEQLFREGVAETATKEHEFVILPLYSERQGNVPEKSGLNAWNAGGRARKDNEVYIPIPVEVRRKFPDFFPDRHVEFTIKKPDGSIISAKVTQDGGKAITSNPLTELGEWLLRDVLNIPYGVVVTMEKLQDIGLDSVIIHKEAEGNYTINFKEVGSYEDFKQDYLSD